MFAQRQYRVTVVAQHMPGDASIEFCSPWAGAQWLSTATTQRQKEVDALTYQELWRLASEIPESGVRKVEYVEYFDHTDFDMDWLREIVREFRTIPSDELPTGAEAGVRLMTVSINPQVYLSYLQSRLLVLGVTFIRQRLSHISEAPTLLAHPPRIIVNATGLLASKLGGVEDQAVYPTRGQTIHVRNECSKIYARGIRPRGKETRYVIPRPCGGGSILGGSQEPNSWSSQVDPNLANRIAKRCIELAPELTGGKGIEALDIISHNVGLRPTRVGGPRLDIEEMDGIGLILHNYGAGGAGYQSSWGMALRGLELVEARIGNLSHNSIHRKETKPER